MSEIKRYFLHAITPVHSGTGQGVGIIDLPIAREKATGWPVLPGSGVKGVLRDAVSAKGAGLADEAFGKKQEGGEEMSAGKVVLTDAHILCFPVRSFYGTFAYVTCPLAITRFNRLHPESGLGSIDEFSGAVVKLCAGSVLTETAKKTVYLEDLDLIVTGENAADAFGGKIADMIFDAGEKAAFKSRFAIVSDEIFSFLCETATDVSAHVSLKDDTKTVDSNRGGLWYEEAVPAEAIFSGIMMNAGHIKDQTNSVLSDLIKKLPDTVQIGGKSSVGRGLCRLAVK